MNRFDDLLTKVVGDYAANIAADVIAEQRAWGRLLGRHGISPPSPEKIEENLRRQRLADTLKDIAYEWGVWDLLHDDCGDW